MNPGADSVTFTIKGTTTSRDKLGVAVKGITTSVVDGCNFQPLAIGDVVSDTEYSHATHRCISPATAVVLSCKAEDILAFQGKGYRVQGVKQYRDWRGRNHHVTITCIEQAS